MVLNQLIKCTDLTKDQYDMICELSELNTGLKFNCKECEKEIPAIRQLMQVNKDVTALTDRVNNLEGRVEAINMSNQATKDEISNAIKAELTTLVLTEVKEQVAGLTARTTNQSPRVWNTTDEQNTPDLNAIINAELREQQEIEKIKMNLIVSGLPESDDNESDLAAVKRIIKDELKIDVEDSIVSVARLKREKPAPNEKPRLLKLVLNDARKRKEIIRYATKLRESLNENVKNNLYITFDQTRKQQLASKNLWDQLKDILRLNPTKQYKITKGVIEEVQA